MRRVSLTVASVSKSFGARRVLRDITLSVGSGEVVAVTGANGSGKSTLLKIIAGLLRPTRGSVMLAVEGGEAQEAAERRRLIGYAAPDLTFYPELTGRENLLFFERVRGRSGTPVGCDAALDAVGLGRRGEDRVATYSSGMRQRLRLAFAQMAGAPFLLLDEPSLALDEKGVGLVSALVAAQRAAGGVTLLATNDTREATLGDRAIVLGE
jgi:heme exporter protein A